KSSELAKSERLNGGFYQLGFRSTRRSILQFEIVTPRTREPRERDQSHQLTSGGAHAAHFRLALRLLERDMRGRDVEIGEIDGNLGALVLVDVPAHRFRRLERSRLEDEVTVLITQEAAVFVLLLATGFADGKRDVVGFLLVARVEVHVVRDQELAGAD